MGGLNNLGNTCYLNAAIQCLLSVPPFVEYFISGRYEKHINEENKLGTGGLLAKSFAKLIREMASTNWCYKIHVGEFKRIVSKHQSRFRGYDQNDAEEFLSYLLDALHEDLNRIIEKPYKEIDDDFKKSDEERAVEIWAIHKSRNDSIIVDLFHFLLKSTVECSRCGEKSITFDPTAILSVPINVKEIMWITVVFIPLLPEKKMVKCKVKVTYKDSIYDLIEQLIDLLRIDAYSTRMVLSIMDKNRVKKIYCDVNLSVTSLYDDLLYNETVYAYELAPDSEEDDQNCLAIIYNANGISGDLFGIPWLVRLHSYQVSNYDCLKAAVMFISCRTFEWPKDEGVVKPFVVRDYASPLELPIMKYDFFELDSEISEIFRIVSTDYTGRESRFVVDRKCVPDYRKLVSLRVEWQPYFTRYIDRRHNFRYHESYRMYIEPRKKIHLKHCLNLFASEEDLDENHWYCPQCKKHRPAKKQLSLWTLPRVLLVHFKRFSHDRMHKIRETVFYPTKDFQLDNWLANRKIPERIYDLVGVCKHEGNLAAGHYITHSKRYTGWFEFDDKNVKRISEDDIVSTNAYLLIYLAREEESPRDYY